MEDKSKNKSENQNDIILEADQIFSDTDDIEDVDAQQDESDINKKNHNNFLLDKSAPDLVTYASMVLSSFMKGKAAVSNSKMLDLGSTFVSALGYTAAKKMDPTFTYERYDKNEKAYESLLNSMLTDYQEDKNGNEEEDKSEAKT